MQGFDLARQDGSAAAPEDPDVGAGLCEPLVHVGKELVVAALVGGDGHGVGVFLDGAANDLVDGPVVAEVDDLGPGGLDDAAHDVDGCVVAIEQRRRRDDPERVLGFVDVNLGLVHGSLARRDSRQPCRSLARYPVLSHNGGSRAFLRLTEAR